MKITLLAVTVLVFCVAGNIHAQIPEKPNILFIIVDDLNDYSGLYESHPQISTPTIDSLAATGLTFLNGYASNPGCAPSRTSMLSGKSALYTQVFVNGDYDNKFRDNFTAEKNNEVVFTLPEILKDSGGYYTFAINKVFHSPTQNDFDKTTADACSKNLSWNRMINFDDPDELKDEMETYSFMNHFDFGALPDDLETQLVDYLAADTAIAFLNEVADGIAETCDRPFFLAVGFKRPHSDRYIPAHYFPPYYQNQPESFTTPYMYNLPYNGYPYSGVVMPPQPPEGEYADFYSFPEDGVANTLALSGDYRTPRELYLAGLADYPVEDSTLSEEEKEDITIHSLNAGYVMGYISAVQYIDQQIGRVISTVASDPVLSENTIIILISDHGYALGEKNHYGKWGLWECINRVPVIFSGRGIPADRTGNTITLLDIFPTLLEMTGTNPPLNPDGSPYLDGHSIMPVLEKPDAILTRPALSIHKRGSGVGSCYPHYSVRTDRYHLISYRWNNDGSLGTGVCDDTKYIYENELYDIGANREVDPEEWNNLAGDPEYSGLVNYLSQFFPDSSLYNKPVHGVSILSKNLPCAANHTTKVRLRSRLYSPEGDLITPSDPSVAYRWTHSLGNDTITTPQLNFNLNTIPAAVFDTLDHIIFYLEILDPETGAMLAFDQFRVFTDDAFEPEAIADFHLTTTDNTAYVTDLELGASVTSRLWDIDGVYTTATPVPAPYTATTVGMHHITLHAGYGNGCTRTVNRNFAVSELRMGEPQEGAILYPNPGKNTCWVATDAEASDIRLVDMAGREQAMTWAPAGDGLYQIRAEGLAAGVYLVVITRQDGIQTSSWFVSGR